jgi:hypothetical protein
MRVYAKCVYGQEESARRRIEAALGQTDREQTRPADGADSS